MSVAPPAARRLRTLPVRNLIKATRTSRILQVQLGEEGFDFQPGQATMIGLHGQARKPYSIASAPEDARRQRHLEFLIRLDDQGSLGDHLNEVRPGSLLDLEGPVGSFVFPADPREQHFLFIAGGTGMAPLRAMLRHRLAAEPLGRIGVLYSARTAWDFAFVDELEALAQRGRIRLTLTVTREADASWRGERGRIDLRRLAPMVEDAATLCFVCGPASLVAEVPALLAQLGVLPERIRMEEW